VTSRFGKKSKAEAAAVAVADSDFASWGPPSGESSFASADSFDSFGDRVAASVADDGPFGIGGSAVDVASFEAPVPSGSMLDFATFAPPLEESRLRLDDVDVAVVDVAVVDVAVVDVVVDPSLDWAPPAPVTRADFSDSPTPLETHLADGASPFEVPVSSEYELEHSVIESVADQSNGPCHDDHWTTSGPAMGSDAGQVKEIDLLFESLEGLGNLNDIERFESTASDDIAEAVTELRDDASEPEIANITDLAADRDFDVTVERSDDISQQFGASVGTGICPIEALIGGDFVTEAELVAEPESATPPESEPVAEADATSDGQADAACEADVQAEADVQIVVDLDGGSATKNVSAEPALVAEPVASSAGLSPLARSIVDQLFQLTTDGLAMVTPDGVFERVSPAFASLFSLMPVFLEGRPVSVVFQSVDVPGLLGAIAACTDPSVRLRSGAVHAIKSNGEPVVMAITIAGFDAGATQPRVILSARDVRSAVPQAKTREVSVSEVDQRSLADRRVAEAENSSLVEAFDGEVQGLGPTGPAAKEVSENSGLPKRTGFRQSAESLLDLTLRANQLAHLLVIDVSDFNTVVTRFGETAGDALLRDASEAVMALIGPHDVAGRLSGSELGVLLTRRDPSGEQVRQFVERLRTRANALAGQRNREWDVHFTTGVAVAGPFNHKTVGQLLSEAEQVRRNDCQNGLVGAR
jgi:diguanylate cyclase (GGDEF)-like protein